MSFHPFAREGEGQSNLNPTLFLLIRWEGERKNLMNDLFIAGMLLGVIATCTLVVALTYPLIMSL